LHAENIFVGFVVPENKIFYAALVSTNKTIIYLIAMQTYKELIVVFLGFVLPVIWDSCPVGYTFKLTLPSSMCIFLNLISICENKQTYKKLNHKNVFFPLV
jgi:hypothetical protein